MHLLKITENSRQAGITSRTTREREGEREGDREREREKKSALGALEKKQV
jgi:hypothetical protein